MWPRGEQREQWLGPRYLRRVEAKTERRTFRNQTENLLKLAQRAIHLRFPLKFKIDNSNSACSSTCDNETGWC
jgi:hypothetical protein